MKKLIILVGIFFPVLLLSQRVPTDIIALPVQSTLFNSPAYLDVQNADDSSFYVVRTKAVMELYSNDPFGSVIIEKRRNSDFSVLNSVEVLGKANVGNIEADGLGNLYIAGSYRDSVLFDTNNVYYTTSNYAGFVVKLDDNLQIDWVNASTDASFITVSPNGKEVFARGDWNGMGGNVLVYQFDSSGNVLNTKSFNNIGYLSSIKTNDIGELYFAGGCLADSFQLDTIFISSNFSYDMYYGKLNANMKAEWIKVMDDQTCTDITIEIDTAGNALFFGSLNKSITLDTFHASPNLSMDFLLSSLAPLGKVNFIKSAPANFRVAPSFYRGMTTSKDKVAIFLRQDPNYNIHWGNNIYTQTGQRDEQLIVEIDISSGSVVYANIFQTNESEKIRNILYLSDGDIITTGKMHGSSLHTSTDTIMGNANHFYIEKWELPTITSLVNIQKPDRFAFYPNPSEGDFRFSESISGRVYDITGKMILSFNNRKSINLEGFVDGLYILTTHNGSNVKLIKR